MEFIQEQISSSWSNTFILGMSTVALYPMVFVPVSQAWTRHSRSINRHSSKHGDKPRGYWFVVVRALAIVGILTSFFLRWAATTGSQVVWSWSDATISNTLLSGIAVFYLREFVNYWLHRLFHANRFLYETFHAGHHEIEHVSDPYDGIYGHVGDSICGMLVIYGSFMMMPQVHIFSIIAYLLVVGLFGFMLNHCGRQVIIRIGALELYNNQHHDVHHTHRHGNFSDFVPVFDQWFGTEIVLPKTRRPLPAVERWNKVRENLAWLTETERSKVQQLCVDQECKDGVDSLVLTNSSSSVSLPCLYSQDDLDFPEPQEQTEIHIDFHFR